MLDEFSMEKLIEPLQTWFLDNYRILPWREDPSPYHVWISEIMLQQTRVEAVKPYYARFMEELPDVEALASCPEDRYLKLWEGLGYYSRVRNLHAAAVQITEGYQGEIPSDYEELLKLKGIGHYTAGAISSIAYGKPAPAVDGNVLRVLTRVSADDRDIMSQAFRNKVEALLLELMKNYAPEYMTGRMTPARLKKLAGDNGLTVDNGLAGDNGLTGHNGLSKTDRSVMNAAEPEVKAASVSISESGSGSESEAEPGADLTRIYPGIFNQALMELGAMVCLPNGEPKCRECPWQELCRARAEGKTGQLPVKKKAKERRIEDRTVLILCDGDKVAIHRRPDKGLLAGLYELPNLKPHLTEEEALEYVKNMGYMPLRIRKLDPAKHVFSHVEWHMIGYQIWVEESAFASEEQKDRAASAHLLFAETEETKHKYAIPNAFLAYTKYMDMIQPLSDQTEEENV